MANETKFQPGDVVQLKSGGYQMTVERYSTVNDVTCVWLDSNGLSHTKDFYYLMLKSVRDKPHRKVKGPDNS